MEKLLLLKMLPVLFSIIHFSAEAQEKKSNQHVLPDVNKVLAYYQSQEYLKASEYIRSFHEGPIQDLAVLKQLGLLTKAGGDYVKAKHYFQNYLQIDSNNVTVLFNLATIYQEEKNTEEASSLYKAVLVLDSSNVKTYQAAECGRLLG